MNKALPIFAFAALVVLWQLAAYWLSIPSYILPSPLDILGEYGKFGFHFLPHLAMTLETILTGFAVATAIAIPLGAMIASSRLLSSAIFPLIVFAHAIPVIALAPIIVVSLGPGFAARVVVVVLISFFPILVSTITGVRATPREMLELSSVAGATGLQGLLTIKLPSAIPYIFNGLRIGVSTAVIGGVVGEFIASDSGLGYLVVHSTTNFDIPRAMASVVILALASVILYQSVEWLQKGLFPWSIGASR